MSCRKSLVSIAWGDRKSTGPRLGDASREMSYKRLPEGLPRCNGFDAKGPRMSSIAELRGWTGNGGWWAGWLGKPRQAGRDYIDSWKTGGTFGPCRCCSLQNGKGRRTHGDFGSNEIKSMGTRLGEIMAYLPLSPAKPMVRIRSWKRGSERKRSKAGSMSIENSRFVERC